MVPDSKTKQSKYEYLPAGTREPKGIPSMRVHTNEKLEPRGRILSTWSQCPKTSQAQGNRGCFCGVTDFYIRTGGRIKAVMVCKRQVCDSAEEHEDVDEDEMEDGEVARGEVMKARASTNAAEGVGARVNQGGETG